jgi:cation:H+ antiporter
MATVGYLLLLLILLFGLSQAARFVLPAAAALAQRLRLSDYVVAFVVLGIATSLPEMSVAVNAAAAGTPQLSFGNLLGGIVVLLTLVSGLAATIHGRLPFSHAISARQLWLGSGVNLAPLLLVVDGRLSRLDGVILMAVYIAYVIYLGRTRPDVPAVESSSQPLWRICLQLLASAVALYFLADWAVNIALRLSIAVAVPPLVLGLLLLGFGTNTPELATALRSRRRQQGLALGHLLGSASANTFIAGFLGFVAPFNLSSFGSIAVVGVSLVAITALFNIALRTDGHLSRREGIWLVVVYALFALFSLLGSQWWG